MRGLLSWLDLDGDAAGLRYLARILYIADRFVSFLSDQEKRERVEGIATPEEAMAVPEFAGMRDLSAQLQPELVGLFLDSSLGQLGRKYLMF